LSTGQLLIQWTASQWLQLSSKKIFPYDLEKLYGDINSQHQYKDNKMIGHKSLADRNKYIELREK
jgi:hypothetical protein